MGTIISCSSNIVEVTVYGRGAMVTRSIHMPDSLPDGPVDVEVGGITPLCEEGSVRAELNAQDRQLVALQSSLVVPPNRPSPGPTVEKADEIGFQIERLQAEQAAVRTHIDRLQLRPSPAAQMKAFQRDPQKRVNDSLALGKMIHAIRTRLDDRILELDREIEALQRQRDAALLADSQARSEERMGTGHPTRQVLLRLDGAGQVDRLRLTYVVKAARWWPVYTLRLEEGGVRATWWIEGLVAQRSGEDWKGVRVALSTASLVTDVRLPELPSLRLGRAQPQKRVGYRPPPPDLDRLFVSFDEAFSFGKGQSFAESLPQAAAPSAPSVPSWDNDEDESTDGEMPTERARKAVSRSKLLKPLPPPSPPPLGVRMAAAPPARRGAMPIARIQSMAMAPAADGGAFDEPSFPEEQEELASACEDGMEPESPNEIEPTDAWLDFDSLRIAGGLDRARRGRLFRQSHGAVASQERQAIAFLERLAPLPGVRDPLASRGSFDHLFQADGHAELPSDGRAHRLSLCFAESKTRTTYRTVPIENPEVYRELLLNNPFDAPILDGPVDVYVDGSLLVTSDVGRIDRGGTLRIGLGVEDRIRVARNLHVEEETTGLLGGSTSVHHHIRIELRSSLGRSVAVQVLERIPDTDDRHVEVKMMKSSHPSSRYTQEDRGVPIRGGLSFTLDLTAGATENLSYDYRINLPSKNEILGGNRRD